MADRLPTICAGLFAAKTRQGLSFEEIGAHLGRDEVAVAGIFYGQVQASEDDIKKLAKLLGQQKEDLVTLMAFPDRGRAGPMPPVEPLQYRLYEIVQNYGISPCESEPFTPMPGVLLPAPTPDDMQLSRGHPCNDLADANRYRLRLQGRSERKVR